MVERTMVDGVEVLVEGRGTETLLMLHDIRALWDGTVEALRDHFCCARFTGRGSRPGSARRLPTLDELMALVLQVVDRLSAPRGRSRWRCMTGAACSATSLRCVNRSASRGSWGSLSVMSMASWDR